MPRSLADFTGKRECSHFSNTAEHHGSFEAVPTARLVGLVRGVHGRRERGTPEEASAAAGRYMDVKHVLVRLLDSASAIDPRRQARGVRAVITPSATDVAGF
jgi:hypothetical protein